MRRSQRVWVGSLAAVLVVGLLAAGCAAPGQSKPQTGTYEGIPVGVTAEGYPYIGDLNAPVVMTDFSDFQ